MSLKKLPQMLIDADWAGAERLLAPHAAAADASPSLIYNYGKVLFELGRFEASVATLIRVVEAVPDHQNGWFELGRAALQIEDYGLSYDAFATAFSLDSSDADARRNFARVALRVGRWEVAREAWEVFEGDPEADIALYRISAETGAHDTASRRARLLSAHPQRAQVIQALVRVSKGSIPLDLRPPS